MKEEFNLSEKLGHDFEGEFIISNDIHIDNLLREKDVKEVIRRLKEEISITEYTEGLEHQWESSYFHKIIDKLAGKDLI